MAQTDKIYVIGMRTERYIAPMMAVLDYMKFVMPNLGGFKRFPDCFKKEFKSAYDYKDLDKFHEKLISMDIEELESIDKNDPSLELKLAIAYKRLQPELTVKEDRNGIEVKKTKESPHVIHLRRLIELNRNIFNDLGKLEGNIIFYNPVSKNITKEEVIDTERFYVPAQFITDPFHLSHRKSYAFLKMADANRIPYKSVIMIPDSIVIIPYKADFEDEDVPKIVCALPEAVKRTNESLKDAGRAELPRFEKTLDNEQGSSLYELKTWAVDMKRLENLIRNEPDDFKEYFDRYGSMDSVLKHVRYEAAVKKAVKRMFTHEAMARLDREKTYVRLWAMKSSQSYEDFSKIMIGSPKGYGESEDMWLVGGNDGCMRNADKSPYGELCESSLRILNGYVLSIAGRTWLDEHTDILKKSKGDKKLQKPLRKKKMDAVKFYSCPGRDFSFYLCEYFAQCTDINKSKAFEKDFYCPNNFKNIFSKEDFAILRDHTMRLKWGFSSAASVFYRMLKGENMNIVVRSMPEYVHDGAIDVTDSKGKPVKKKKSAYEHSDMVKEFSGKMIFPFIAPDIEIPKRDLRGTDFIYSCDIMRLLAKHRELPPESKIGPNAIVGTLMHTLSNDTPKYADGREIENYGPTRLWKKIGVEPLKNRFFCEIPIFYVESEGISPKAVESGLEKIVVSGRTDEVGVLLDEKDVLREELNSIIRRLNKEDIELNKMDKSDKALVKEKEERIEFIKKEYLSKICEKPFDLIITDFKCGKKSEKLGYRNQALVYGLGFVQNYNEYGLKVNNFYINIVTRPYTQKSSIDATDHDTLYSGIHRPQVLNMFKVKNSSEDLDVSKLRKEAVRTAELQRDMASDWTAFNEHIGECRKKRRCDSCFNDVKLKCERVVSEQGRFKNLTEMAESYKKEKEEKEMKRGER